MARQAVPQENEDNSTVDDFSQAIEAAMGTLQTKLIEYITNNVAPLVSRVEGIETRLSQSADTPSDNKTPSSIEARLAQLEREKAEALAEQKRQESADKLRSAIQEALGGTPNLEDVDFLKDTLFQRLQSEAEETPSGWLLKGTGKTPQEYVTDFMQKTGKRFIKVDTVPGSGTPEPKQPPKSNQPTDINSVITNTLW